MAVLLSPGVSVNEKDYTTTTRSIGTSTGGHAGIFNWGPIEQPQLVSTENELLTLFGKPTNNNVQSFTLTKNFLEYSNSCYVTRLNTNDARNAVSHKIGYISSLNELAAGNGYYGSLPQVAIEGPKFPIDANSYPTFDVQFTTSANINDINNNTKSYTFDTNLQNIWFTTEAVSGTPPTTTTTTEYANIATGDVTIYDITTTIPVNNMHNYFKEFVFGSDKDKYSNVFDLSGSINNATATLTITKIVLATNVTSNNATAEAKCGNIKVKITYNIDGNGACYTSMPAITKYKFDTTKYDITPNVKGANGILSALNDLIFDSEVYTGCGLDISIINPGYGYSEDQLPLKLQIINNTNTTKISGSRASNYTANIYLDALKIKNSLEFLTSFDEQTNVNIHALFAAKYPGILGNNLTIAMSDGANWSTKVNGKFSTSSVVEIGNSLNERFKVRRTLFGESNFSNFDLDKNKILITNDGQKLGYIDYIDNMRYKKISINVGDTIRTLKYGDFITTNASLNTNFVIGYSINTSGILTVKIKGNVTSNYNIGDIVSTKIYTISQSPDLDASVNNASVLNIYYNNTDAITNIEIKCNVYSTYNISAVGNDSAIYSGIIGSVDHVEKTATGYNAIIKYNNTLSSNTKNYTIFTAGTVSKTGNITLYINPSESNPFVLGESIKFNGSSDGFITSNTNYIITQITKGSITFNNGVGYITDGTISNPQSLIVTKTLFNEVLVIGNSLDLYTVSDPTQCNYIGQISTSVNIQTIYLTSPCTVSVKDATVYSEWEYKQYFNTRPGTSNYAASFNSSNDEIHVLVIDKTGKITGVPGTILEKYEGLSKAKDAKNISTNASIYYKDVINLQSNWIWCLGHPLNDDIEPSLNTLNFGDNASALPFKQLKNILKYTLSGGIDTITPTESDIVNGYKTFMDKDNINVSLIFLGHVIGSTASNIIQTVAEERKDCLVFVSPPLYIGSDILIQDKIKKYRESLPSSSYAVLDSGWKYQYDQYNDKFIWVPLSADIAGLCAYTDSVANSWWSPAGLTRGQIKNVIKLAFNPTEVQRDVLYANGINPVVTFKNEGTVLYGDKTLLNKSSAFDRINVRRLFITLEKVISTAAKYQLFEFNDDFTRTQFISMIEPYLRNIQALRGITEFYIKCDSSNNNAAIIDANQFVADIFIKPARSINFITLNFVATKTGTAFSTVGA